MVSVLRYCEIWDLSLLPHVYSMLSTHMLMKSKQFNWRKTDRENWWLIIHLGIRGWDFNWIHSHTYPDSHELSQDREEIKAAENEKIEVTWDMQNFKYSKRSKRQRKKESIQVTKQKKQTKKNKKTKNTVPPLSDKAIHNRSMIYDLWTGEESLADSVFSVRLNCFLLNSKCHWLFILRFIVSYLLPQVHCT